MEKMYKYLIFFLEMGKSGTVITNVSSNTSISPSTLLNMLVASLSLRRLDVMLYVCS